MHTNTIIVVAVIVVAVIVVVIGGFFLLRGNVKEKAEMEVINVSTPEEDAMKEVEVMESLDTESSEDATVETPETGGATETGVGGNVEQTTSPTLSTLSPSSGIIGTTVIIAGTGFSASGNDIHFSVGGLQNIASINNGTRLIFTIPEFYSRCDLWTSNFDCTQPSAPVIPGTYDISVTNANGNSNKLTFNVEAEPESQSQDQTTTVRYTDSGYDPKTVTISAGDTVTFINESSRLMWTASKTHPVHRLYPGSNISKCGTAEEDTIFDACEGTPSGSTWSFVFNEVGDWRYHNHVSTGRTGTISVE